MDVSFTHQFSVQNSYLRFSSRRVVESANVIMATYADDALGDTQVYPEKGTVCFSAGLHGWAFTLTSFAKIYANKFGVEVSLHSLSSTQTH